MDCIIKDEYESGHLLEHEIRFGEILRKIEMFKSTKKRYDDFLEGRLIIHSIALEINRTISNIQIHHNLHGDCEIEGEYDFEEGK